MGVFMLLMAQAFGPALHAQGNDDYTISPYFYVSASDTTVDHLPLKNTSAEVKISGVIADVTVNQVYCNEGEEVLEAIYVFPLSTRAAVYAMNMHIGNRILIAKIEEKQKAREQYEEARDEGRTATLLEQERPNVFRMNVVNILPGDTIRIEMKYTELLVPTDAVYEFVYPTVVGPRYVSPAEDSASTAFAGSPFTPDTELSSYDFGMDVEIEAGLPLKALSCPSHDSVEIEMQENHAHCMLTSKKQGDRDFILHYILAGDEIESGLLLYEGEEENFFLAMIQPPEVPTDADIPPREYVFIMDVSGSMHGIPIETSKNLLFDLIDDLRFTDRFNILFFAGNSALLSDTSLEANYKNKQYALAMIDQMEGMGGTELLSAVNRALELPVTQDYSRSFVITTDGYVTVETATFDLIREKLGEANFFPFGIGSSVNRYIIEGIAHVGMAEPFIVLSADDAAETAERFRQYIQYPVLTNIDVAYENFEVYDVEPLSVPDVLAERPIILYGKWQGEPVGQIHLAGRTGTNEYNEVLDVSTYSPSETNSALRYLWARKRIQMLDDYCNLSKEWWSRNPLDSTLIQEIIELGIRYNLLTNYTSFIAIDSMIRNEGDSVATVVQPSPTPDGMDDTWNSGVGNLVSLEQHFYEYNVPTVSPASYISAIYPNPARELISLSVMLTPEDLEQDVAVALTDVSGRLLHRMDLLDQIEGENTFKFNLKELIPWLKPGVYILKLSSGQEVRDYKMFVFAGF